MSADLAKLLQFYSDYEGTCKYIDEDTTKFRYLALSRIYYLSRATYYHPYSGCMMIARSLMRSMIFDAMLVSLQQQPQQQPGNLHNGGAAR